MTSTWPPMTLSDLEGWYQLLQILRRANSTACTCIACYFRTIWSHVWPRRSKHRSSSLEFA